MTDQAMLKVLLITLSTTLIMLSGCSTQPRQTGSDLEFVQEGPLSVIQQHLAMDSLIDADKAIQEIDVLSLSADDQIRFYWLKARLAIALGRGDEAITALNAVDPGAFEKIPEIPQHESGFLRAQALYLKGSFIASARERMFLSGVLSGDNYVQNHQGIWASLLQAETTELETLSEKTQTSLFKGWLALALVVKKNQMDLDRQLSNLRIWQAQFSSHPAAKELPGELDQLEDVVDNKADFIALMLPLDGKLARTGQAIRDGFFAAYYEAVNAGASVPRVKVYDTSTGDFWTLYKQAILDGNELVIGPLTKTSVERLQQESRLPVPTLALNYGQRDFTENPAQLYQFGLAVEDEAELSAQFARQKGFQSAVALVPEGSWGERVFYRFSQSWQAQGGALVEAQFFKGTGDYNKVIRQLLSIDDSERRAADIRRQLRTRLEFQPRRRQDVDFIFVAALPQQARQIKPTLAFNFAQDLPMIATSQVYSGSPSRSKDSDLNGVMFCDIPWILDNPPLRQTVKQLWSQAQGSLDRLYAMGADAFTLYPRLEQIKILRHSRIPGHTGRLAMDDYGQIVRQLSFAQFKNGIVQKTQGVVGHVEQQRGLQ
ncbi:penicillin-binding protein activator [Bermanella sp. R86510]|uniref:penicillin-binding protein activator n=1 Tax=unclassified Bermanella TaxID=2627862 RepID=UPI0037C5EFE7